MSETPRLYIAGLGMITPVGANTAMTAAAVRASMNVYAETDYYGQNGESVIMASVPTTVLDEIEADILEGSRFNIRHHRVLLMAIQAVREACAASAAREPVPLVLAMPEEPVDEEGLSPLLANLEHNCKPWIDARQCRRLHGGRAAGLMAIDFAFRYLYDLPGDYCLVGGSDSYRDYARLDPLSEAGRLKVTGRSEGFAPGEAGGFLLLTRQPERALARNGHIIALHPPGLAEEPGHLHSQEPYRGDGLDQAFKKALGDSPRPGGIHSIYSSMNGEYHWAKEYGVAFMRNRDAFRDPVGFEHPADCFGDLGCATAPVLIGLAAEHLFRDPRAGAHLVYSSSDRGKRGAIVVEKQPVRPAAGPAPVPSLQQTA